MIDKILKLILLLTPIVYYPGVFFYKFELMFFQIASIFLFMACLLDKPKRNFNIGRLIALYLGICLFSVMINNYEVKSLSVLFNIFLACIDIFIITVYVQDLNRCFKWLGYGIILNSIVYIWQLLGYHPLIVQDGLSYGGIPGNAPRFSFLLTLAMPFLPLWYLLPLFILGIFLKKTCVFFSIICVIVYKLSKLYKDGWHKQMIKILSSLLTIFIIGTLFIFRKKFYHSVNVRLWFWKETITQILNNPFKGWGLGNFKIADYASNSFLQWIHAVGILGAGFIVICLKKIKWYLVPLLFLCLVEYPFEIPRLWFLIICSIAYWAIETKEEVKIC